MTKKSLILLSSGLDSAVNLAIAADAGEACYALTLSYGQKAEAKELAAAKALASFYKVEWLHLDVSWLGQIHANSLTSTEKAMPEPSLQDLDQRDRCEENMQAVWVANRNGLFINIAAAVAESRNIEQVLVGFNREEAASFPDNSADYLAACNQSLQYSTLNKVELHSYTLHWDKREIMAEAIRKNMPLDMLWSCYHAGEKPCGVCESCKRWQRAYDTQSS